MNITKDQSYTVYRYFKTKRPAVLKRNLSKEEAIKFCEESPTKKKCGVGNFNSFVGFSKD